MELHRDTLGGVNIPKMSQGSKCAQTITSSTGFRKAIAELQNKAMTHPVILHFPFINQLAMLRGTC